MVGRHMPASNFVHSFIHVVPLSLVGHTTLYNKYRNDFFMLHFSLTAFLFALTLALSPFLVLLCQGSRHNSTVQHCFGKNRDISVRCFFFLTKRLPSFVACVICKILLLLCAHFWQFFFLTLANFF